MVELEGLEPKKKSFWAGFGESVLKGLIQTVNQMALIYQTR
ncbi:hypothetical protein [Flavobacterium salmonis]|nr:hypothetical protein [Flavobacterium salmonis]